MKRDKRHFFAVIFLILFTGDISPLETIRQSVFLEDTTFSLRYTFSANYWSLYVSEYFDPGNNLGLPDFSFNSDKIKAGRLLQEGIWKELFNPFGFMADSEVYYSKKGIESDVTKGPGGIYGFSLIIPGGVSVHSFLYPSFHTGAEMEILKGPGLCLAWYGSVSAPRYSNSDEWISPLPELSVSEPVHAGIGISFIGDIPFIKLVVFLSGNKYFRPDIFSRLYWNLQFGCIDMYGLTVYAGRDYILPAGTPVKDKLLLSSSIRYSGRKGFGISLKGDTHIGQESSYPSVCTARRSRIFCTAELESGWIGTTFSASVTDEVAVSGIREDNYSIKGSAVVTLPPLAVTFSAGEKGGLRGAEKRWCSVVGRIDRKVIQSSLGLTLTADINDPDFFTAIIKGGVKIDMPHGELSLTADFTPAALAGNNDPAITGLSIGFVSTSSVPYQIRRKNLAVSK